MELKFQHNEYIKQLSLIIIAVLTLVATMAWSTAIESLFVGPCGSPEAGIFCKAYEWGPWFYAITITAIAVIIIVGLTRFSASK